MAMFVPRTGSVTVSLENRVAPRKALRRPERLRIVIGLECRNVRRQRDPRQFGASINMHVGRELRRLVERADADERERLPTPVMAPDRRSTGWAAVNVMRASAVGRNRDGLGLA